MPELNDLARGGTIQLTIDGEVYDAKGDFEYHPGVPKRDDVVGADKVHGYKESPVAPYIQGKVTDRGSLDLKKLLSFKNATVALELYNGKVMVQRNAWYSGSGAVSTGEAEIDFKSTGL